MNMPGNNIFCFRAICICFRAIRRSFCSNFSLNCLRGMWKSCFYESEIREIHLLPKPWHTPWCSVDPCELCFPTDSRLQLLTIKNDFPTTWDGNINLGRPPERSSSRRSRWPRLGEKNAHIFAFENFQTFQSDGQSFIENLTQPLVGLQKLNRNERKKSLKCLSGWF